MKPDSKTENNMFKPLTKEEIEERVRQPVTAEKTFYEFLDENFVFEDYLCAIKNHPVIGDGKKYNDIKDITRNYNVIDWVMKIDWIKNEIGSHSSFGNWSSNRLERWTKLNTAWNETVRNLQEVENL